MIIVFTALAFVIGFFLGRGSIKVTYGGKIVMSQRKTEEDTTVTTFSLEVNTPIDELGRKKHVIFQVVPLQPQLF